MRLLGLMLFAVIVLPSLAFACKCYPANDELGTQTYMEADIVIRAKIINPSKGFTQSGPLLMIQTLETIKGENVPEEMNVNYNNVPAACGNEFEKGDEAILGIYDTRDLSANNIARGYGFRLMSSCQQLYIRHHVNMIEQQKIEQDQSEKETE